MNDDGGLEELCVWFLRRGEQEEEKWVHLPCIPLSLSTFFLPPSLPPSLPPFLPPSLPPLLPPSLSSSLPPSPLPSGAASSGDIDIILGHPDYTSESSKRPPYIRQVVQRMEAAGFITDTLSLGESKFMVRPNKARPYMHNVCGTIELEKEMEIYLLVLGLFKAWVVLLTKKLIADMLMRC